MPLRRKSRPFSVTPASQKAHDACTVLGIDPGLATTGFGVLSVTPSRLTARTYGVIRTPAGQVDAIRLATLQRELAAVITRYRPDVVAVEKLFFNTNITTAMAVSQARGVVLAVCGQSGLPVRECTPLAVKLAVSGYGRADKRQMQRMVMLLLKLKQPPRPDDAADALAVAICGARLPP